jgi:hypothetical protein
MRLLTVLTLLVSFSANAQLVRYESKSASSKVIKISDSSLDQLINSKEPLCIKDGARIVSVNKAFDSMGLGYRDCSDSVNAKETAKMKGYTVNVIKFSSINAAKAKALGLI